MEAGTDRDVGVPQQSKTCALCNSYYFKCLLNICWGGTLHKGSLEFCLFVLTHSVVLLTLSGERPLNLHCDSEGQDSTLVKTWVNRHYISNVFQ